MVTKSGLAIRLSQLEAFQQDNADFRSEQYNTDSEIAAESIWLAYMKGDIEGKVVADLGAGSGILGIAALELGAKHVYFIEKDESAIRLLKRNLEPYDTSRYHIMHIDINQVRFDYDLQPPGHVPDKISDTKKTYSSMNHSSMDRIDTVIMNPPFGTRERHADKEFLEKAFTISNKIYTFHKTSTADFIDRFSAAAGFRTVLQKDFAFPIKQMYHFHKSRIKRVEVTLFCLSR